MSTLWKLENLAVGGFTNRRLGPLSLDLQTGFTAVTGPSGAGKSTLLHVLAGFEKATSGSMTPTILPKAARLPLYWAPAGDGLWEHLSVEQHLRETGAADPRALLEVFGLAHLAKARPNRLSRGERHRVALGRALAANAQVLLLDEPLAHVGRRQARVLWEFISTSARQAGTSILFATHDPMLIASADHTVELDEGRLVQSGKNC